MHQPGFAYRFDWGLEGLQRLAPTADVVVIVDVLRFTSAVCAALEAGATVLPYPWAKEDVHEYADSRQAIAAGFREDGGPSLSPTDLLSLTAGTRLVLPSPNGATLAFHARTLGVGLVLAGSLRNASATAHYARFHAGSGVVAVVASGEQWGDQSLLRPAVEDLLGAGAVLSALDPSGAASAPHCSPEATAARAAFRQARPMLYEALVSSSSGRELLQRGWDDDVATSAALDVTDIVCVLSGDQFVARRIGNQPQP